MPDKDQRMEIEVTPAIIKAMFELKEDVLEKIGNTLKLLFKSDWDANIKALEIIALVENSEQDGRHQSLLKLFRIFNEIQETYYDQIQHIMNEGDKAEKESSQLEAFMNFMAKKIKESQEDE